MGELPLSIGPKCCLQIILGVASLITRDTIPDLKIKNICIRSIDELMRVSLGRKPCTIAGLQDNLRRLRHQGRGTFKDIDEFILFAMAMKQGGFSAWRQAGQINTEIVDAENIAKLTLFPPTHAAEKGFRVV